MNVFRWVNLAFGILGASTGVIALRGVIQTRLSSASVVRFFRWSLIASIAGLLPVARHIAPLQQICIISVYCSAAAVICWRKLCLVGRARQIFAACVTAVLYFDFGYVFTWIFKNPPLLTVPLAQPLPPFQVLQILFAFAFIVIGVLAVRGCRIDPARTSALGKFTY